VLTAAEFDAIGNLCRHHRIALIVDQVFADYRLECATDEPMHVRPLDGCLTFILSGLSKVAGLPQAKLSWGLACGPDNLAAEAMARIELINDAYLSVGSAVQLAAPYIVRNTARLQTPIAERIARNLAGLRGLAGGHPISVPVVEGGWAAVVRLPQLSDVDDDAWVTELRSRAGVAVLPGRLFELPRGHVVVSLLTEPTEFDEGGRRLIQGATSMCQRYG
jgi:hypothetical protein